MDGIDRVWNLRIIATLVATLLVVAALAFVVVPVVGAQQTGLDAFTAICRAIGITVGSSKLAAPTAAGPEASRVAWTTAEFTALSRADKSAGANLAQASCTACHAADGSSADPAFPRMAGQSAFAIYKQLQDFKSGARRNDVMSQMVQPLDTKQMADLAAYYASLRRNDLDPAHPSFAGAEIEMLALYGDPSRALPPCAACHGTAAGGPLETPTLFGQSPTYLSAQLQAFADDSRRNDVFQRMRAIVAKLTPREMVLFGAYYTTPH